MREWVFAVILCTVIFVVGMVILIISGSTIKEISSVVVGFLWGNIVPILVWGFRDRIKSGKLARKLRLGDPLLGFPSWIDKGRRYYRVRSQLPALDSILSIKNLKRINILSISCYIITIEYIEKIREAINRGVEFNFLILDPNSQDKLNLQSKNYPTGKNLKQQLQNTIITLCNEKEKLPNDKKGQLAIYTYDKVIRNGIMIVYLDKGEKIWIKSEDYPIRSDPNSRPNQAAYKNDDENFFQYYQTYYNEIFNKSVEHSCKI